MKTDDCECQARTEDRSQLEVRLKTDGPIEFKIVTPWRAHVSRVASGVVASLIGAGLVWAIKDPYVLGIGIGWMLWLWSWPFKL